MRCFMLYRGRPPEEYRAGGYANPPEEWQLQGVVFSDGTVCVRWLTELRSHSLWPDFKTFERVHGHPEYESRIVWFDLEGVDYEDSAPIRTGDTGGNDPTE